MEPLLKNPNIENFEACDYSQLKPKKRISTPTFLNAYPVPILLSCWHAGARGFDNWKMKWFNFPKKYTGGGPHTRGLYFQIKPKKLDQV